MQDKGRTDFPPPAHPPADLAAPGLSPSHPYWCIAPATRARVIIDAADYFEIAAQAMQNAQKRIMLIGWDFDTRIDLLNRDTPHKRKHDGPPSRLGPFIRWLARRTPGLDIYLLKWNFGMFKLLGRGSSLLDTLRWMHHRQIHFRLDSAHPVGCSHHQKIVVIDDSLAVCGGIDMTADRWDTRAHLPRDHRRRRPSGRLYGPWHDSTMMIEGPAAAELGKLARWRWEMACGEKLEACTAPQQSLWPEGVRSQFDNVEIGIARTRAPYRGLAGVREIEESFLDHIRSARKFIYAESQYFASRRISEAIALRMAEPDPPEIILINPLGADGWLEQEAMDSARQRLLLAIGEKDHLRRFHVYAPHSAMGEPIYVHAKLMIVDDVLLHIGSANMNNRSLGLDSECDLVIDTRRPANHECASAIKALRLSLLAEHTGTTVRSIEEDLQRLGSMRAMIEARQTSGRYLKRLALPQLSDAEKLIADNALLDPEKPSDLFEPIARRGLFTRSRILDTPQKA